MAVDLVPAGCPALEAVEEDDGEVELSLGLSIGRSSRKAPRSGAETQGLASDVRSGVAEADLCRSGFSLSPSPPPPPLPPFLRDDGADALDVLRRREIHALRRQEARKKRDEKQQKKGMFTARNGEVSATAAPGFSGAFPPLGRACSSEDRLALEAQEHQMRVRDREAREEAQHFDRGNGENRELGLDSVPNHKLSPIPKPMPSVDANANPSFSPNNSDPSLAPFGVHPFPLIAMQCPYPHMQYVPTADGFGIPCMMPCWAPVMSPVTEGPKFERNVFQPVPRRSFPPFSLAVVEPTNGGSPLSSNSVESSDGKGTGVKRAPSWTASQGSSSSPATSDHQSGSLRGGSSSTDTRSHSGHGPGKFRPQLPPQVNSLPMVHSDNSISSRRVEPVLNAVEEPPVGRSTSRWTRSPNPTQCAAGKPEETASGDKPVPAAGESNPPQIPPPLPRMPCVSTTGNGPNGKTITGFLHRYTKTEVSIVCVCHGSSFTPAEFVKHAGGTDVEHPLRQITVVSS